MEAGAERERALLKKLADETEFWKGKLTGDNAIYRALQNAGIRDLGEKKKWIGRMKAELWRRARAREQQSIQRTETDEAILRMQREQMMRDAYAHEKRQPRDAYARGK